jgi:hypothetical protein
MRPYQALACAVISQAFADIARKAAEDLEAAREGLENLSTSEAWGIWLACLGMEPEVLCEALSRRLERGERLQLPTPYPEKTTRHTAKRMLHGEPAAADEL